MAVPPEPIIFMKATSAHLRPERPDHHPARVGKTDWEVELGVVIGTARQIRRRGRGAGHVAGYAWQRRERTRLQAERAGQWTKGKSCDNFGQTGPLAGDPRRGRRSAVLGCG
jgi:2-keto-4-pentenoate hydratase/2-oxohepta-3-ene-1,7-dioic acid hydratase in catechol pathway